MAMAQNTAARIAYIYRDIAGGSSFLHEAFASPII